MLRSSRWAMAPAMPITSADGDDYVATMGDNRNKADEADEADRTDEADRAGNADMAVEAGKGG